MTVVDDIIRDLSPDALRRQGLTDGDIEQVRAFAAFLRLPKDADGKTLCPPAFFEYARGGPVPPLEEVAKILDAPA